MKISEQWLREWVDPALDTEALSHQLTMAGLEVDGVEPVAGHFSGVVVAAIVATAPHPDADKLQVCEVDTGEDQVQIVCGAPNARPGIKVPLATVGAVLPGNFKIKKAKLRGVESRGMLCAEQELGLGDGNDGLMELPADAQPGTDIRQYLQLDDKVIEIGLTPNRADCLSVMGIAREVGLLSSAAVTPPAFESVATAIDDTLPVVLQAQANCPRYLGRVIRDIDLSRPSPLWLQEKLRRCGLRPIDPVVDVTNYVLLELGQPMHAFDLDRLSGGISVRMAAQGEELELLNGQLTALREDTLVIADDSGAVAMAGIMGGQPTAVGAETRNIFLEAAYFTPELLAGKARAYGLHTDSSHRYERGVDFQLQRQAMERASQLLLEIVGGSPGPIIETVAEADLPKPREVSLRAVRIKRVLGFEMPAADVERIFQGLGFSVATTAEGWCCGIPSWRFDIALEADLLEELARVYGYSHMPASSMRTDLMIPAQPEGLLPERHLRRHLAARGFREAITYSFVDPKLQHLFDPDIEPVALSNPISTDMAVMRSSLLPGLVSAVVHNSNRQQARVRLFETGLRFIPTATGLEQTPTLTMVASGNRLPENWASGAEAADFFDLKGDLESLLALTRSASEFSFSAATRPGLHPGQTALITRNDHPVGYIGALHPTVLKELGLSSQVCVCELDQEAVRNVSLPVFAELSKFPEVRRDLALVVDRDVSAGELMRNVRAAAGAYLTDLRLFDVYEGKGIDPKRKSLGLGLTFRDQSRTLSDADVNKCVEQVLDLMKKNYNAELRV